MNSLKQFFCLFLFCIFMMVFSIKTLYQDTIQMQNNSIVQNENNDCQDNIIGYVVGQYQHIYKPRKVVSCAVK